MVKAYPALKPKYPRLVWVAYAYAAVLCIGAVAALIGLGGFDFASVAYSTPGLPVMTIILAGLAIFALPFLTRLDLSPLARFLSALFAATLPFVLLAYVMQLMTENVIAFDWLLLASCGLLVLAGTVSSLALDARSAIRFSKD